MRRMPPRWFAPLAVIVGLGIVWLVAPELRTALALMTGVAVVLIIVVALIPGGESAPTQAIEQDVRAAKNKASRARRDQAIREHYAAKPYDVPDIERFGRSYDGIANNTNRGAPPPSRRDDWPNGNRPSNAPQPSGGGEEWIDEVERVVVRK